MYTPYLPAQAGSPQEGTVATGGTTSSGSSPEKITGAIKKEIIGLLKENGLPSDVSTLLSAANTFLSKSTGLSNYTIFGGEDDDYDLSDLMKIQQLVNDVKYNNNLRNGAVQQITKEAAGSEVAVSSRGEMYVLDKDGNLTTVNPTEYSDDKYQALTNDQLLYYREHQEGLAFDTSILNDLQNSIGMNSIMKYLIDTVKQFGTDELGGYTTKDDSVNRGLELLTHAGPDGYYQFDTKDQLRDVNKALHYLYNGLSDNAKNLLRAKTAAEGGDPSDFDSIGNLLMQVLYHHPNTTRKVTFDKTATDFSISAKSGATSGDDAKNLKEYNYVEKLAAGQNSGLPELLKITHDGSTVDMNIIAWNVGNIVKNKEEDSIGSGMLDAIRHDAYGLEQAANQGTVQFGDQEFDKNAQSTIYYDGTPMYRTKMPATRNNRGEIIVDWRAVQLVNDINERLRDSDYTPEMLTRLLNETDPRLYIDENGQVAWADDAWFLTFEAIVANNYQNHLNIESPYIQRLSREEEAHYKEKYEVANKYGYTNPASGSKERVGRNQKEGHFIIDWKNHDLYRSKVFMPVTRELAGSAEFYPAATHMDNMNTAMARERQVQLQKERNMGIRKFNFEL